MADWTRTPDDGAGLVDSFELTSEVADAGMGLGDSDISVVENSASETIYVADAGMGLTDYGTARGTTETIDDAAGATDPAPTLTYPPGEPPTTLPDERVAVLDTATLSGGLTWLYGMQEQSGAVQAGDVSGAPGRPRLTLSAATDYGTAEFGAAGIMPEGTALLFQPAAETEGGATTGRTLGSSAVSAYLGAEWAVFAVFAWSGGTSVRVLRLGTAAEGITLSATSTTVTATLRGITGTTSATVAMATNDNAPHMAVITMSGSTLRLTVDTSSGTAAATPGLVGTATGLTIGDTTTTAAHQVAWVGHMNAALTAEQAADLANLGSGGSERTDLRVARICRWVGVASDLVAEQGLSDVAYQAAGGNAALDLIHDVATVEDGVAFPDGEGRLVFHARAHRRDSGVALALTADEVSADLQVQVDLTRVVNDVTLSRPRGATTRARDEASVTAYGPRSTDATVYAASDDALADIANWRVLRYGTPAPRIPRCTVDLLPMTADRAAAVLSVRVGDRIQITGLPSSTPGGTTVTLFVEGVAEGISHTSWSVTWATSPAFDADIGTLDDTAVLDEFVLTY